MDENALPGVDLTQDLVAETNRRAEELQRLAFGASSMLSGDNDIPYFVVSREYHSGLFYGFLTNVPVNKISAIIGKRAFGSEDSGGDIVGFFRDEFSRSFERPGPLRTLSQLLNGEAFKDCWSIAVTFDWAGAAIDTQILDSNLEALEPSPDHVRERLLPEALSDSRIAAVAAAIATKTSSSREQGEVVGDGFCLVVSARQQVSDPNSIRRRPLQLMQIMLQAGMRREDLQPCRLALSRNTKSVLISSSVAAYSVLYERERYFEKAIRQSIKGAMIKSGGKDAIGALADQIRTLHLCNDEFITHAAPYISKYGFRAEADPIPNDRRNVDRAAEYPWYEMVRYSLPSLDNLLTTTPGLQDFEVRAIARAILDHLEWHFWKLDEATTRGASFEDIPVASVPVLTFATLRNELSGIEGNRGSIEKIKSRIRQWRDGIPIQVDNKGLAIPNKSWSESQGSLWQAFLAPDQERKLYATLCSPSGNRIERFPIAEPDGVLQGLIASWASPQPSPVKISLPTFKAVRCHGDPHFENILIDASIPEDPFIVAIDPTTRRYNGNVTAGAGLDQARSRGIINAFGCQPMHDISKLLLSTTGGYALALKNGFVGKLEKTDGASADLTFVLQCQTKDKVAPLGADATGISGASLYVRSVSATSDAMRYHHVFSVEVLDRLDCLIDQVLSSCNIKNETDRTICRNIYYIQVWAWVVRHTFSIAEKLFPERIAVSDQLLVFGSYLLHSGAKYLQESGLAGLSDRATQNCFRHLLSLNEIMELGHEK